MCDAPNQVVLIQISHHMICWKHTWLCCGFLNRCIIAHNFMSYGDTTTIALIMGVSVSRPGILWKTHVFGADSWINTLSRTHVLAVGGINKSPHAKLLNVQFCCGSLNLWAIAHPQLLNFTDLPSSTLLRILLRFTAIQVWKWIEAPTGPWNKMILWYDG